MRKLIISAAIALCIVGAPVYGAVEAASSRSCEVQADKAANHHHERARASAARFVARHC